MIDDLCGARKWTPPGCSSKPIAHLAYATFRFAAVRADVLARDVK
jgi:hypothetical protein